MRDVKKIFLPQETLSAIKEKHIFIDTCVFIDCAYIKDQLLEKLMLFKTQCSCSFVTVDPVVLEFIIGTASNEELEIKKKWLERMVDSVIPVRSFNQEPSEDLILAYGERARGSLSYTDFCLALALKHFSGSVLLTRNHKDFPLKIFDVLGVFTINYNEEVRTYCFYEYRRNKLRIKPDEISLKDVPF